MLLREIELLKLMDHPNIIKVVEIFQSNDELYLVMEMCTGGELTHYVHAQPGHRLTERRARPLISKMLRALAYLHANHMIHRDIKPENFIFTSEQPSAELKMIDFGLSRQIDAHMTRTTGTPEFMAPEVAGHDYSEKSDLWSLGVTLFVMVCGSKNLPFTSVDGDRFKIPHVIASSDPRDHRETLEAKFEQFGLSDNLRDLLHKLLTVDPNRRVSAKEALQHPWVHKINLKGTIVRATSPHETIETHNHFATFCEMTVLQRTALLAAATTLLEWPVINKLNSQFEALDEDQDGVLSFDEFRAGFLDEENDLLPNLTEVGPTLFGGCRSTEH